MSNDDMNQVLDEALKVALYFLQKSREFFPFSVTKTKAGEIHHVNVWNGQNERPKSDDLIEMLRLHLKESAARSEIVCAAIISDVRFNDTSTGFMSDAIRAEVEHAGGQPVTCFLPYRVADSQVEPGEIVAQQGMARIFV